MSAAKVSPAKAANNATLQMIGLTRSSSQEVADGYGPSIQKSEIINDAKSLGYRMDFIRDIIEPATIELEERDLFNGVLAEAASLKKANKCDGLCFSRCDRLSRRFDAALQIALDCKKNGLSLRFVRENQWLKPDDEPLQFVLFVLQAFGVHTQTNVSMTNLLAGRRRAASEGKLPGGAGSGILGYTLENKKFKPSSFINVVDEILDKALQGQSINGITKDLRARGIRTQYRNVLVTRSTVASILRNARRYAGIWHWGGYELRDLIPARISEEQADRILDGLKRNREKSFGFGKRKWLTSRVVCGLCGHRYSLGTKHGCVCFRSSPMVAQPPCTNLRISWRRLSHSIWTTFIEAMTSLDALELCVRDKRHAWIAQRAKIVKQVTILEDQLQRLEQKRRQYSWQHAESIISEEELKMAFKQIKAEESVILEQKQKLDEFKLEPAPLDMATFKRLAAFLPIEVASNLRNAPDDMRAKFAETFELQATIHPDKSQDGYHLDLAANIPLEMQGEKLGAYDMVFRSSGCVLCGAIVHSAFIVSTLWEGRYSPPSFYLTIHALGRVLVWISRLLPPRGTLLSAFFDKYN